MPNLYDEQRAQIEWQRKQIHRMTEQRNRAILLLGGLAALLAIVLTAVLVWGPF